jgi:hypothetical protein
MKKKNGEKETRKWLLHHSWEGLVGEEKYTIQHLYTIFYKWIYTRRINSRTGDKNGWGKCNQSCNSCT